MCSSRVDALGQAEEAPAGRTEGLCPTNRYTHTTLLVFLPSGDEGASGVSRISCRPGPARFEGKEGAELYLGGLEVCVAMHAIIDHRTIILRQAHI